MGNKRDLDRDIYGEYLEVRDDRVYLIACDDQYAPKQYFEGFQKSFLQARLRVEVIETKDGTSAPKYVLERLLASEYEDFDERWLVLDIDHNLEASHRKGFQDTLAEARRQGVKIALSKPCFEFWLLLHYTLSSDPALQLLKHAKETTQLLHQTIGGYNKTKLNPADYPIEKVASAILQSLEIDSMTQNEDNPAINTSRVHQIWEQIIKNSTSEQLPDFLKPLKEKLS